MRTFLISTLATLLFGLFHSLLAARVTKDFVAGIMGQRWRNAFYRPLYIAQALITSILLVIYLARQPYRVLYHLRGPWAWVLNGFRMAALLGMAWASREIGFTRLVGWVGIKAFKDGESHVPPEAESQGPAYEAGTGMRATGPFRYSRHPLNLLPVPFLWLSPKMTDRRLAFAIMSTLYFWLGSKHEEARLIRAYGEAYRSYQTSGVGFFLPRSHAVDA